MRSEKGALATFRERPGNNGHSYFQGKATCLFCRHLDFIERLRAFGGREYLCHHPDADPLGPRHPAPIWPEAATPDWCLVGPAHGAEGLAEPPANG
jgi:hypothetical protein